MMNWKRNMPLQVAFRFYNNQDILQITTFRCPLFTGENCYWPNTCTADYRPLHLQEYASALLSASNKVSELLLSLSLQERASHLYTIQGVWLQKSHLNILQEEPWSRRKNYKKQEVWLSPLWDLSLLQDRNLSAEVFANSGISLCHTLLMARAPMSLTCNAHRC